MTEEKFESAISLLTDELKALRQEMTHFRLEFAVFRERTSPVVEHFWKVIGVVLVAVVAAVLALVMRGDVPR